MVLEYIAGGNFQGYPPGWNFAGSRFYVPRRLLQVAPRLAFEIVMGYVIPTMDKNILKEQSF
jgi:hypothetical protein